jgi:phosphate transport system protein
MPRKDGGASRRRRFRGEEIFMVTTERHTLTVYDQELEKLGDTLTRMSGLAESQFDAAMKALADRDTDLAIRVVHGDEQIDRCEQMISDQVLRLIALQAPVANDLRTVITSLKVAGDIERIGDHAANCAKRALVLNQMPALAPINALMRLARTVAEQLRTSLDAYLAGDAEQALVVRDHDQEVDDLYSSLFREIITYMMEDPRTITAGSHLMFIAKNIERIGDHATNIAEMTYFLVTGQTVETERPKHDIANYLGGDLPPNL